jgi:hypothetical protein
MEGGASGHDGNASRSNGNGSGSTRMDLLKPEMPSQRIISEDI